MARTTIDTQLAKIRKAKADLEKKEKALLVRTSSKVIAQIVQLAKNNGISLAQIAKAMKADGPKASAAKKSKTKRVAAAPKYRNPTNAEQTWSGRGKAPLWVKALKDADALDTALIK